MAKNLYKCRCVFEPIDQRLQQRNSAAQLRELVKKPDKKGLSTKVEEFLIVFLPLIAREFQL